MWWLGLVLRFHLPICMFLRFDKAEWNCAAKGNIFMRAQYFFFFQESVSPAENNSRDTFLKTSF